GARRRVDGAYGAVTAADADAVPAEEIAVLDEFLLPRVESGAGFASRYVEEAGRGIERRRIPVRRARDVGTDQASLLGGLAAGQFDRSAVRPDLVGPGRPDERSCTDQFAVGAIECVEEPVAVG